jgi:hypothetical protein
MISALAPLTFVTRQTAQAAKVNENFFMKNHPRPIMTMEFNIDPG